MAFSFLDTDTDTDIFSVGAPTDDGVPMFGGLKKKIPGLDDGEADTDNIFSTEVLGGDGGDIVATTPQAIVESGSGTKSDSGTDTGTTVSTGTGIPNIYDPNVVGADGGTPAGIGAGNVLRTDITYVSPSGFQKEGPAGRGIYVSPEEAGQLGLGAGRTSVFDPGALLPTDRTAGGANIPIFNLGGTAPSAGTSSVTPVTQTTTPTQTGPKTIDDYLQSGTKPTAEEMSGLIDQRLKAAQNANKQLGGSGQLSNDDIDALVTEVYDEIYTKEGGLKSLTKAPETGPQRPGIPLIIPIPGLDPTTAAIISAIGLIRSGGKVSTIDPTNPLGSLINIGKGIFDTSSGTPGGAGGGAGGGTAGGTGGGGTLKIGTPTQEELDALEKENQARREAEDLARQGASAAAIKAAQDAAQKAADERAAKERAQEEETARIRAGVMGIMGQSAENRAKVEAEAEEKRKADEAAAAAGTKKPTDPNVGVVITCPSPETPILLPDLTTIPAGDLKVGTNVLARLENQLIWGGYGVTRVEIVKSPRLKFTFDYGPFTCSPSHKFCHNDWEWREAQSYSVGDEVQDHKILAIEDDGVGDVVVITVDEAHTYVAGPFLSHNKSPPPEPECGANEERINGQCVPKCGSGMVRNAEGVCVVAPTTGPRPPLPPECGANEERINGQCVPKCGSGMVRNSAGVCVVAPVVPPVTPVPTTPTTPTTPAGGTFNVTVTGDQTPIAYEAPKAGDPFQRYSWEEASSQLGMLNTPVGQRIIGYQKDASGKDVPVYSRVPLDEEGNPLTVGGAITSEYGKMAGGMTQADLKRLQDTFGGFIGQFKGAKGEDLTLQQSLTRAAAEQTTAANRALREGNLADAAKFGMEAKRLRDEANAQLYGDTGTLGQYATAAQNQVARDIEALRAAERGELSRESIRSAQQAALEAAGARGQVRSRGAMAQEVLNREAAIQQRQQQARQNLAQSMAQLGQGIGYQAANVFDPMAAVLGQQYGMQTSNVGLNQALYNQGMGLASGQGGYGFAQQMVNPFSQYAADVYGTNVNARNAFAISEANRLAALEAARMGEAAARNAANTKLALGGVDFLYKYGMGKGWWE
jgi:hypothetical protein